MKIKIKNKKDKNDGHVIFIDKLTDHHIQDEKKNIKKDVFSKKNEK